MSSYSERVLSDKNEGNFDTQNNVWTNPENIALSERRQTQEIIHYVVLFTRISRTYKANLFYGR